MKRPTIDVSPRRPLRWCREGVFVTNGGLTLALKLTAPLFLRFCISNGFSLNRPRLVQIVA
jgi:hypothetical protein